MEPLGTKIVLNQFQAHPDFKVTELVTDANSSICKFMPLEYGSIKHETDKWHFVKLIMKKTMPVSIPFKMTNNQFLENEHEENGQAQSCMEGLYYPYLSVHY